MRSWSKFGGPSNCGTALAALLYTLLKFLSPCLSKGPVWPQGRCPALRRFVFTALTSNSPSITLLSRKVKQLLALDRDVFLTGRRSQSEYSSISVQPRLMHGGLRLVTSWSNGIRTGPRKRFQERILHTSLTVKQSMRATAPAVHLHAQFTFAKRVDRTQLAQK